MVLTVLATSTIHTVLNTKPFFEAMEFFRLAICLHGSFKYFKSVSPTTEIALLRSLPVDDIPDVLHIRSFTVQILPRI